MVSWALPPLRGAEWERVLHTARSSDLAASSVSSPRGGWGNILGGGRPERGQRDPGGSLLLTRRCKNSTCSKAINNRNSLWIRESGLNFVLSSEPVFSCLNKEKKIKINSVCRKFARGDLGTGEIGLPRLGEGRGGEAFQVLAVKVSCWSTPVIVLQGGPFHMAGNPFGLVVHWVSRRLF